MLLGRAGFAGLVNSISTGGDLFVRGPIGGRCFRSGRLQGARGVRTVGGFRIVRLLFHTHGFLFLQSCQKQLTD